MEEVQTIETERLRLRQWQADDLDAFAAMCADPEVMHDWGGPQDRELSERRMQRYRDTVSEQGYGRWLVETLAGEFLGYCGVMPAYEGHALGRHDEVGWRLKRAAWGKGYATESAIASLNDVFERIGLDEVLSYTTAENDRSQAVMQRLRLRRDESRDFVNTNHLAGEWQGLTWVVTKDEWLNRDV